MLTLVRIKIYETVLIIFHLLSRSLSGVVYWLGVMHWVMSTALELSEEFGA